MEKILNTKLNRQRKRVVIVSEIFYPSEKSTAHILTQIANHLASNYNLIILTASKKTEENNNLKKYISINEEDIIRLRCANFPDGNLFQRSIKLCILSAALCFAMLRHVRKDDIVLTVTNPAPLIVMIAIVRKILSFRLLLLVHDVFPENAVALGILDKDSKIFSLIKNIFDQAYRSTNFLISIGRDMSEILADKLQGADTKVVLIENWADENFERSKPRKERLIERIGLSDKIILQYAGNFGRAQGCVEFLDLISTIENPNIKFIFRGSGVFFDLVKEASQDIDSVWVDGSFVREEENMILQSCDIGVVILNEYMFGLGVPSKAYNILASGKPILFLGPEGSEIYRLVKENNLGWVFDWSQTDDMLDFLNKLSINDLPEIQKKGEISYNVVTTKYSRQLQMQKYDELFKG